MKKALITLSALMLLGSYAFVNEAKENVDIAHASSNDVMHLYDEEKDEICTRRIYSKSASDLAASMVKHFSAPAGYVVKLSISDEQADFILSQAKEMEDKYLMVGIVITRIVNGAPIYSSSEWSWTATTDDLFKEFIKDKAAAMTVLDTGTSSESFMAGCSLTININDSSELVFDLNEMEITPYQDGELIKLNPYYYNDFSNNETRINLSAEVDDDLFNRVCGLPTDGASWNEYHSGIINGEYQNVPGWDDRYTIEFISDGVSLGTVCSDYTLGYEVGHGIEIEAFPTRPLNITALVKFTSNGEDYVYKSQTVTFAQEDRQLFINGYNNRKTVGKGVEHTYSIDVPEIDDEIISCDVQGYYTIPGQEGINSFGGIFNDDEPSTPGPSRIKLQSENKPYSTSLSFEDIGEHKLHMYALVKTNNAFIKYNINDTIVVEEEEPSFTPLEDALQLVNTKEKIYATLNGDPFTVAASIAKDLLNDGDEAKFTWTASKNSIVDIIGEGEEVVIAPINAGTVTVNVVCNSDTFSGLTRSINITIVNEALATPTIDIPDEFHKTGEDLTLKFNLAGYSDLINLKVDWKVYNLELEEDAVFVDNLDGTITIKEAKSGAYEATALVNGEELARISFAVRQMDMQKFARDNLIWIFLIMVGALALFVTLRVVLSKKHSLEGRISKAIKIIETIDVDSPNYRKELRNARLSILSCIEQTEALNMENLNQYEETEQMLRKANDNIKGMVREDAKMDKEVKRARVAELLKTVNKALILASELGVAQDLVLEGYKQAQNNNYIKEDKKNNKAK